MNPDRPDPVPEDRFPGNLLLGDVHFDESRTCEDCGAQGAYDLRGAYLCAACAEDALRGLKLQGHRAA
jgi:hypothetical protein